MRLWRKSLHFVLLPFVMGCDTLFPHVPGKIKIILLLRLRGTIGMCTKGSNNSKLYPSYTHIIPILYPAQMVAMPSQQLLLHEFLGFSSFFLRWIIRKSLCTRWLFLIIVLQKNEEKPRNSWSSSCCDGIATICAHTNGASKSQKKNYFYLPCHVRKTRDERNNPAQMVAHADTPV